MKKTINRERREIRIKLKIEYIIYLTTLFLIIAGCSKEKTELKFNYEPGVYNEEISVTMKNYKDFTRVYYAIKGKKAVRGIKSFFLAGTKVFKGGNWNLEYGEKLEISYITVKRGEGETKGNIVFEIKEKLQTPKIEIIKNRIFIKTEEDEVKIFYKLKNITSNYSHNANNEKTEENEYKIYEDSFLISEEGEYEISVYLKGINDKKTDSEKVVNNFYIEIPKIEEVKYELKDNILKLYSNDKKATIKYKINNEKEKIYNNEIFLDIGTYHLEVFQEKIVNEILLKSNKIEADFEVKSIPKDFYFIKTDIIINNLKTVKKIKDNLFLISQNSIKKLNKNNNSFEKKLNYKIKDVKVKSGLIYLLCYEDFTGSRVLMMNDDLEILNNDFISKDEFEKLGLNNENYLLVNNKFFVEFNKKIKQMKKIYYSHNANKEEIITNLFDVEYINSEILIKGEKKGKYGNVESFIGILKDEKLEYISSDNKKNEYYLGSIKNHTILTIEDRKKIKKYKNGELVSIVNIPNKIYINNSVYENGNLFLLGYTQKKEMYIIRMDSQKNVYIYMNKKNGNNFKPYYIHENGDYYIVEGIYNNSKYAYMKIIKKNLKKQIEGEM